MAGQGPSRRELLHALALGSAAHAFPGFWRWRYALAEAKTPGSVVLPTYQPRFFSAAQYRTVELLCELILPASEETQGSSTTYSPGATDAGVTEFIDFSVSSDATLQLPFHAGLAWLDQASTPAASFAASSAPAQAALLTRLAYKRNHRAEDKAGQAFFLLLRKYVVTGFYTTEIGMRTLDYPGFVFYGSSPGCDHQGNPEHAGLWSTSRELQA